MIKIMNRQYVIDMMNRQHMMNRAQTTGGIDFAATLAITRTLRLNPDTYMF